MNTKISKIPVILDTDIGSDIDDTWALAMLLNCPELDPRLVVTTNGDTLYRAHLVAKFLQTAGRSDIPIATGLVGLEGTQKFQQPWLEKIITPLDTCSLMVLDGTRYQRLYRSKNPTLQALIENYRIWAKLVTWMEVDFETTRSSVLFDTVAVYLAYACDLLEMERLRLRIRDDGLTLPDPDGDEVLAALRWRNLELFYDHLVGRLVP